MLAPTPIAAQGPTFSRLVAGVMTWGEWGHRLDETQMAALIGDCLALGITTFDHADIYGHYTTEAAFGAAFRRSGIARGDVQLVSKCGIRLVCPQRPENTIKSYDLSRDYIIASAERSLRNLQTDYLDLLLIHRPSPLMDADEVAAALAQLVAQGKVLHVGVSNFTPGQFSLLNSRISLATNQVEASLLHTAPLLDGTFDQAQEHRLRPMVWSPLGNLFQRDDAAATRVLATLEAISPHYGHPGHDVLLLAWLLRHPARPLPVLGTARTERLRAATHALDVAMTDADWFALLAAATGREVA